MGFGGAAVYWGIEGFAAFPAELTQFVVIPSAFALVVGVQVVLNAFVLSIVSMEHISSTIEPR